jgi:hypothetical protein
MNPFFILLWLITFASIVSLFFFTFKTTTTIATVNETTVVRPSDACVPNINTLKDISTVTQCCLRGGQVTASRYVPDVLSGGVVLNPGVSYYLTVCGSYCNSVDADGGCIGPLDQQTKYAACIEKLKPVGCVASSLAQAHDGTTLFYVESVGNTDCQTTTLCSNAG